MWANVINGLKFFGCPCRLQHGTAYSAIQADTQHKPAAKNQHVGTNISEYQDEKYDLRHKGGQQKGVHRSQRRIAVTIVAAQNPDGRNPKPDNGNNPPNAEGHNNGKRAAMISARQCHILVFLKGGMDGSIEPREQIHVPPGYRVALAQQKMLGNLRQKHLPHIKTPVRTHFGILPHRWIDRQGKKRQGPLGGEGQMRRQWNQRRRPKTPANAKIISNLVRCKPSIKNCKTNGRAMDRMPLRKPPSSP